MIEAKRERIRTEMKIIVLHDKYTDEPVIIKVDTISAVRKLRDMSTDPPEEYASVMVDHFEMITKETIGEVIKKIKKAEGEEA